MSTNQPLNSSGLTAIAMQLASDYWGWKSDVALDEVFPGTWNWLMDGAHDIVWSFSAKRGFGSTRIMKTQWNLNVPEMQHSATALSGFTNVPRGVGGPSVAQSWRDSQQNITPTSISTSGTMAPPAQPNISVNLTETFLSGDMRAFVGSVNYLPTQNRWRGTVDNETILFEGTSGGLNFPGHAKFGIDVVYRAVDGTFPADHANQSIISQVCPNTTYGVNLVTHEKSQFVYPQEWTSGGIQGCNVVPQVQTVLILDGSGKVYNGTTHFSGFVSVYDPTQTVPWSDAEPIYAVQRNSGIQVFSGYQYGGQLVGYSPATNSGVVAPVYVIDDLPYLASGKGTGGICCSGTLTFFPNPSLGTCAAGGPGTVFSPAVKNSPTPGFTTQVFQFFDSSGCCQTQVLTCLELPPSPTVGQPKCCINSQGQTTIVDAGQPCPPGFAPAPLSSCTQPGQLLDYFQNSCSITWQSSFVNANLRAVSAFWNGLCVQGTSIFDVGPDCTNSCSPGAAGIIPPPRKLANVDQLIFNACDFFILDGDRCCGDNPSVTQGIQIETAGLTQNISVLDPNCDVVTLCFLHGLLKATL